MQTISTVLAHWQIDTINHQPRMWFIRIILLDFNYEKKIMLLVIKISIRFVKQKEIDAMNRAWKYTNQEIINRSKFSFIYFFCVFFLYFCRRSSILEACFFGILPCRRLTHFFSLIYSVLFLILSKILFCFCFWRSASRCTVDTQCKEIWRNKAFIESI